MHRESGVGGMIGVGIAGGGRGQLNVVLRRRGGYNAGGSGERRALRLLLRLLLWVMRRRLHRTTGRAGCRSGRVGEDAGGRGGRGPSGRVHGRMMGMLDVGLLLLLMRRRRRRHVRQRLRRRLLL